MAAKIPDAARVLATVEMADEMHAATVLMAAEILADAVVMAAEILAAITLAAELLTEVVMDAGAPAVGAHAAGFPIFG